MVSKPTFIVVFFDASVDVTGDSFCPTSIELFRNKEVLGDIKFRVGEIISYGNKLKYERS